jgi:hypothetical protein
MFSSVGFGPDYNVSSRAVRQVIIVFVSWVLGLVTLSLVLCMIP